MDRIVQLIYKPEPKNWPVYAVAMPPLPHIFFFQAEDGIRDLTVTGVQTCALPILQAADLNSGNLQLIAADGSGQVAATLESATQADGTFLVTLRPNPRAGERFPLRSNKIGRASCRERV